MARRNWQGSQDCYFCGDPETNDHLLFQCPIAKVIWGVVVMCFHQSSRGGGGYAQFWLWILGALLGGKYTVPT
jgi:hypothetical protein